MAQIVLAGAAICGTELHTALGMQNKMLFLLADTFEISDAQCTHQIPNREVGC